MDNDIAARRRIDLGKHRGETLPQVLFRDSYRHSYMADEGAGWKDSHRSSTVTSARIRDLLGVDLHHQRRYAPIAH